MKLSTLILSFVLSFAQTANNANKFLEPPVQELMNTIERLTHKNGQERRRERRKLARKLA